MHMKPNLLHYGLSLLVGVALFGVIAARAQDKESDDASFQKYGQVFKGKIGRTYEESEEWYPEAHEAEAGHAQRAHHPTSMTWASPNTAASAA